MVKSIEFQETAVADLLAATHRLFKNPTHARRHIVFQSPTGSGKTVMLSQYIAQLFALESPDTEGGIVVLWMSIGSSGLHIQSKKSLQKNLGSSVEVSLFDEAYYGTQRTDISSKSVVVLNWESVYNKNKASSEWKNKIMKVGADRYNLPEIIAATQELKRKLIVIVDESHIGSDAKRTEEIHEILKADVTIYTSATPKYRPDPLQGKKNQAFFVQVDPDEVVEAGMIKRDVLINADLSIYEAAAEKNGVKLTGDDLIMEAAFAQRQALENAYPTEGVSLRPLVLIQIPNSDAGNLRLDYIKNFLQAKGISEGGGKLAVWLDDKKADASEIHISDWQSPVEFLVFKQKIATGWDCPRASILVMFRDVKSESFRIQTVGRILRMPEHKHYATDMLNTGYVYVNVEKINIEKEDLQPKLLRNTYAYRREDLTTFTLLSYHRPRLDFGTLLPSFHKHFVDRMQAVYAFDDVNQAANRQKLVEKGFNLSLDLDKSDITVDAKINSQNLDNRTLDAVGTTQKTHKSSIALQTDYETLLTTQLHGRYTIGGSLDRLKKTIAYWFNSYLGISDSRQLQHIILRKGNRDKFTVHLSDILVSYELVRLAEIKVKEAIKAIDYAWQMPVSLCFDENDVEECTVKTYAYNRCLLKKERSGPEKLFENYLKNHADTVCFWYKNGDSGKANFGIRYEEGERIGTFYPDFIVGFHDRRIGIFDTKSGFTEKSSDTKAKAEYLQRYILAENVKGNNLFGGIIAESKQAVLKLNSAAVYQSQDKDGFNWLALAF